MMVNSPYIVLLTLKIFNSNDVVLARQRARQITALLNFDLHDQTKIATVVSEIARNAYQYASGGKIEYCLSKDLSKPKFIVRITDKGPGISNLAEVFAGQYISTTGSGVGIIGSKRIMDEFTINTSSQHGTEVIAAMNLSMTTSLLKSEFIASITHELAKHRPNNAIEEVQYQNQELLHALDALTKAKDELELRVAERTAQLAKINDELKEEISERIRVEEWIREHQQDLARAERINSMGEMASALAHELNQPLAAISSYIQGCMRRLNTGQYQKDELHDVMEKAAQQSIRAGEIIHRMKDFVRKGKLSIEMANINKLIRETITLMQNELEKHQVEIQFILSDNLPQLKLDAIQIQQALSNLIRNALQAMIESNTKFPKVIIRSCLINENHIEIDVEDNGPGFSIEDPQLILQPYFTTKKHGMGMGLSISRTIVEAHGGKLLAKNCEQAQGGAMFKIILPIEGKRE